MRSFSARQLDVMVTKWTMLCTHGIHTIDIHVILLQHITFTLTPYYLRSEMKQQWKRLTFCLSLIEPRPNTAIRVPVSSWILFSELPFGPRIFPTKLNCTAQIITSKIYQHISSDIKYKPNTHNAKINFFLTTWNIFSTQNKYVKRINCRQQLIWCYKPLGTLSLALGLWQTVSAAYHCAAQCICHFPAQTALALFLQRSDNIGQMRNFSANHYQHTNHRHRDITMTSDNILKMTSSEWMSSCLTAHQHKVGYLVPL